jgi:hypothetical protein
VVTSGALDSPPLPFLVPRAWYVKLENHGDSASYERTIRSYANLKQTLTNLNKPRNYILIRTYPLLQQDLHHLDWMRIGTLGARRIVRVTNDIYKIGSNGNADALVKCSAKYEEMKADLAASASRSTAISDEANHLENQIEQLETEISQLREDQATVLSQESTMRALPMDEQEGPQEPPLGDGLGSSAASSASDYDSMSGIGIDDSVDTGGNVLLNPAAPDVPIGPLPYQNPTPVRTLLSQLYAHGTVRGHCHFSAVSLDARACVMAAGLLNCRWSGGMGYNMQDGRWCITHAGDRNARS